MSVKVVDQDCRVEDGKLIIVVEGLNPEQVLSNEAKQLAIAKATACGYSRVGINGQSGSFPVDAQGRTMDENGKEYEWNDMARNGLIAGYRNEIKLMGGL